MDRTRIPSSVTLLLLGALVGAGLVTVGAGAAGTPGQDPGSTAPAAGAANQPTAASQPTAAPAAPATPAPIAYVGEFALAPKHGQPGTNVTASGSGFSPNVEMQLVWQAFRGSWKVDMADPANFKGRAYDEELVPLTTARTDAGGAFSASFEVPEGFGFGHDVRVLEEGVVRNQAAFKVDMQFSVTPSSGPPGTPITIDVKGVGVTGLTRSWLVTYDNRFTGWLSSVTTQGHARAVIPATGGPGKHVIKIVHGSFTFPYLNPAQSPDPTRPTYTAIFTVTDGQPILPPPAETQAIVSSDRAERPAGTGPVVWPDRVEATVGASFVLEGAGLPARTTFDVLWKTQVGVDTGIIGGTGQARPDADWEIGTVTSDASGAFRADFEVPKDKGGSHEISLVSGDKIVANTALRVRPSVLALSPARGPVGTEIEINIQGVDDTDTGKILMLVYDNAMLGYSCSVTAQGNITIFLPATGEPGIHYIDFYPGLYKGTDVEGVYNFRIPQLTYADDHPGEVLPAFHLAFEITP
ncbi:MAG TPA: hypothetical protein VLS28_02155 [Candidatus Sulfomarinibacteraceae bacterium]|nr:hypothetical protein [Candidatus Sulfomarinibacteraceae bacterium]